MDQSGARRGAGPARPQGSPSAGPGPGSYPEWWDRTLSARARLSCGQADSARWRKVVLHRRDAAGHLGLRLPGQGRVNWARLDRTLGTLRRGAATVLLEIPTLIDPQRQRSPRSRGCAWRGGGIYCFSRRLCPVAAEGPLPGPAIAGRWSGTGTLPAARQRATVRCGDRGGLWRVPAPWPRT